MFDFISSYWFQTAESPPTSPPDLSNLPNADKALVEDIVSHTFSILSQASRTKKTKLGETHTVHSLTFKQSESWATAIELCAFIQNQKEPDDALKAINLGVIKDYVAIIQGGIQQLLKLNSEVHAYLKSSLTSAERSKLMLNPQRLIDAELVRIRNQIDFATTKPGAVKTFFTAHGQGVPMKLMQFLNDNWDSLTLFRYFKEVPMLESRLFVKIKPRSLLEKGIPSDEELQKFVDSSPSIRAVFIIQSTLQDNGYLFETTKQRHHSTPRHRSTSKTQRSRSQTRSLPPPGRRRSSSSTIVGEFFPSGESFPSYDFSMPSNSSPGSRDTRGARSNDTPSISSSSTSSCSPEKIRGSQSARSSDMPSISSSSTSPYIPARELSTQKERIERIVLLALHQINYSLNTRKARSQSSSSAVSLPGVFSSVLGFRQ